MKHTSNAKQVYSLINFFLFPIALTLLITCSISQKPKESFSKIELLNNKFTSFPIEINGTKFKGFFDSGGSGIALSSSYSKVGVRAKGIKVKFTRSDC